MLHLTTEIGVPGKQELEKRHFPTLLNQRSKPSYKPQGRLYIPHGYSEEDRFCPHPQHVEPEHDENGPDWTSRLRSIPSPHNEEHITEIWPDKWKSIRAFPWMSQRTKKEWAMYPAEGRDATLRCHWQGQHKASTTSSKEFSHSKRFGKNRTVQDKRNGIAISAPGDKPYRVVECSANFHKLGCTLPIVNFGGSGKRKPDTFVPLQGLPQGVRESWWEREESRRRKEEEGSVRQLEQWRPASPLLPPPHSYLHPPPPNTLTDPATSSIRVV